MANDELTWAPLGRLATLMRKKDLTPTDLVETFLDKIDKRNDTLKAYITVAAEKARLSARTQTSLIQTGAYKGGLHGIPYACKDLFQTKDIPTTGGSRVLEGWVPDSDAEAIRRLDQSGAILLGKLNQHEFAYGATGENEYFGTVPNPWDPSRLAGGSSSGSAAAVAAGLAAFSLGTDTGGSTRAPAALCGVVGFKPTYGLIDTEGVIPYCWSLDHVGIITRTAIDAGFVLHALTQDGKSDPKDWKASSDGLFASMDKGFDTLRIGIPEAFFFEKADSEILAAVKGVLTECEKRGAEICRVNMPSMEHSRTVSLLVQLPEALSYHSRYLPGKKELYGEDMRSGMALGQFVLAEHYVRAKRMMTAYRSKMDSIFKTVDMLITPTCPVTAPKIGARFVSVDGVKEPVGNAITRYTSFFNLTGNPALSLPCGVHSNGLPMGVQLVGRHFEEERLLLAARAMEAFLCSRVKSRV